MAMPGIWANPHMGWSFVCADRAHGARPQLGLWSLGPKKMKDTRDRSDMTS